MSTRSSDPSRREWNIDCKVYIGNLAETASKLDVENAFRKYGPMRNVWVARNPPGFAFVEYEDARDAEDACQGLDGTRIGGSRIRVEMSHGRSRRPGERGPGGPPRNSQGPPRERYEDDRRDIRRNSGGGGGSGGGRDDRVRYDRRRSRSRTPPPRRPVRVVYTRSRSHSRSYSRSPIGHRMRASPIGRSPPPRGARTPPSRSRTPLSPPRR